MDISQVLVGTGVLCAVAFILAIAISIVTQCFYIEVDPCIEKIHEILPHLNCGACGYPGCMPYAEALVSDKGVAMTRCKPGGSKVAEQIKAILDT